jgi:hypothetical protein
MLRVYYRDKIQFAFQEIIQFPDHLLPCGKIDVGIAAEIEFLIVVALLKACRVD